MRAVTGAVWANAVTVWAVAGEGRERRQGAKTGNQDDAVDKFCFDDAIGKYEFHTRDSRWCSTNFGIDNLDLSEFEFVHEVLSRTKSDTKSDKRAENENNDESFPFKLFCMLISLLLLATTCAALTQKNLLIFGAKQFLVNRYKHSSNLLASFPTSYEVFASTMQSISSGKRKTKKTNNVVIPVFFDLQGIESDFIFTTLTDCFNVKPILVDSNGHLNNVS